MSGRRRVTFERELRGLEYPKNTARALEIINELLCSRPDPHLRNIQLSHALMAEFVFFEVDRRGNELPSNITVEFEKKLLNALLQNLERNENNRARRVVFFNLFTPIKINARIWILSELLVIAIYCSYVGILFTASEWMQQIGNLSFGCRRIADMFAVKFFFEKRNIEDSERALNALPLIAPEFTANLLITVAEIYTTAYLGSPPCILLKRIYKWISENSTLCMAAQHNPPALTPCAIANGATTPFAGILRWCVLAPLRQQLCQKIHKKLFLALLSSMETIPKIIPTRAINVQHLIPIVTSVCRYYELLKKNGDEDMARINNDPMMQLALNRFAQAIELALSVNIIYGQLNELFEAFDKLPFNEWLNTVVIKYNQQKSVPINDV